MERAGGETVHNEYTAKSSPGHAALRLVGAAHWHTYGGAADRATAHAEVVRPGVNLAELAQRTRSRPGSEYLIGNEPNVPGQDDLTPTA